MPGEHEEDNRWCVCDDCHQFDKVASPLTLEEAERVLARIEYLKDDIEASHMLHDSLMAVFVETVANYDSRDAVWGPIARVVHRVRQIKIRRHYS